MRPFVKVGQISHSKHSSRMSGLECDMRCHVAHRCQFVLTWRSHPVSHEVKNARQQTQVFNNFLSLDPEGLTIL